jgi:regulator of sigma E protease
MIGSVASNIVVALIVLGIIIVLHELGHFLVAKFFKIKVETFSVGFGPRLLGFRRGDTDYRISAFPLGGYVKMAGETPSDTITGEAYEFMSKPKWQRFLVAAAGPAMNVILAVALLTGLYVYGTELPEFMSGLAIVGVVERDSPAEQAGIKSGDQVVAIDGKSTPNWQDIQTRVLTSAGRTIPVTVQRQGQRVETSVTPIRKGSEEAGFIGMGPLIRTIVGAVNPGSPAAMAGMQAGDEIIRVSGIDLRTNGKSIQDTIQTIPEKTFPITVLRQGQEVDLQVSPITQGGRKMIGIQIQWPTTMIKLGFADAVGKSIQTNIESATLIFQVLGRLFKREASMKQLDGPIGIIRVSGQALEQGFSTLLTLMALISLNLGVLNILPIPILDGGVMLLLLVESLMRRDLSLRVKERIVQVSFVFLLMLTVIVLYNDVVKLLPPTQPTP